MTRTDLSRQWTPGEREEYERRYDDIEMTRRLERVADDRARHESERHAMALGSRLRRRVTRRRD